MTIKIVIAVNQKQVGYSVEDDNITFAETALANFQLDKAKQFLSSLEFEASSEVKTGYDEELDE